VPKISLDLNDKKTIYSENNKSGVYRWTNKITGASYIGSSTDLTRRLRGYLSNKFLEKEALKNHSIIYRALLKYDYSNFALEIIEYCDRTDTIKREQYYLDLFKPEYNICFVAGSSLGRITSDETLRRQENSGMLD
jgi:group I intron endonuclease